MSGGVAVILAILGLILIVIAIRGTYPDVLAVLAVAGKGAPKDAGPTQKETGGVLPPEAKPSTKE